MQQLYTTVGWCDRRHLVQTYTNSSQAKTTDQYDQVLSKLKGGKLFFCIIHSFILLTFFSTYTYSTQLTRPNTIQGGSEDKQWPKGINNQQDYQAAQQCRQWNHRCCIGLPSSTAYMSYWWNSSLRPTTIYRWHFRRTNHRRFYF